VHEHLRECDACRQALEPREAEAEGPPRSPGHIPSAILARWPQARATLHGLERLLVRRHLEDCAECREELKMLGHEPILEVVEGLEFRGTLPVDEGGKQAASGGPKQPHAFQLVESEVRRERTDWARWALGGWAAAATAATFLLVMRLPPSGQSASHITVPSQPTRSVTTSVPSLQLAAVPTLAADYRNAGARRVPAIVVTPGKSVIAVPMLSPLPDLPESTHVSIALVAANGEAVTSVGCRLRDLVTHKAIVLAVGDAMPAGDYHLSYAFAVSSDSTRDRILESTPFKIVIEGH
jgi:hypothetical protein